MHIINDHNSVNAELMSQHTINMRNSLTHDVVANSTDGINRELDNFMVVKAVKTSSNYG